MRDDRNETDAALLDNGSDAAGQAFASPGGVGGRRAGEATPRVLGAEAALKSPAKGSAAAPARPRRTGMKRIGVFVLGLLALTAGGIYGRYWWTTGRYLVTTDDAYVGAKNATLSPKVSGYVAEIAVEDNANVKLGDVIVRIDDGDYRLAVEQAQDQIAVQQATIERLGQQVAAQLATVDQAKAQLASAEAGAVRAELEFKRQQDLATRQINSHQALEQAQATRDQATASVRAAEAGIQAAAANVDVLKAQQEEARRTLAQLQTALAKAERDLSFTVLRAPFDGVLGNRAVQVGDYVQPTQRLASLVPLDAVYIDANFKETQVGKLRPGQPVSISVDAMPDLKVEGKVASFAPGSGSIFSLLPPDNATGNFTKVVQRVAVRILIPVTVAEQAVLRPGMSVVVSVNTKSGAPAAAEAMSTASVRASAR